MAQPILTIDLQAICNNWRELDRQTQVETGAVVKANAYGLGIERVAPALAGMGARRFFVATSEEGATLRRVLGAGPEIFVFSGHMSGDTDLIRQNTLIPLVNSVDQLLRHVEGLGAAPFGVQLDTGMNRLGMEPEEWQAIRHIALSQDVRLIMSHLACADEPDHDMNRRQLAEFHAMTDGIDVMRSLAATGGVLMGAQYHFDLTRPGIGLYGGLPFAAAEPVTRLALPVIQQRHVAAGESVGYGNSFIARRPSVIATVAAGYADGILRGMGPRASLLAATGEGDVVLPVVGRISMDLIGVDVTDLTEVPEMLELLGPTQGVDRVADWAGTIGYEILTSLGRRYARDYIGG